MAFKVAKLTIRKSGCSRLVSLPPGVFESFPASYFICHFHGRAAGSSAPAVDNHTVISRLSLQLGLPVLLRTTLLVTHTSLVDIGIDYRSIALYSGGLFSNRAFNQRLRAESPTLPRRSCVPGPKVARPQNSTK
jgi:hypothetical protein